MSERRKHPRVPYGAWVEDDQKGGLDFYLARNISLGGILLRSREDRPPLGHKVTLRLIIENERRIMSVQGQVIRHDDQDERDFGVEFVNLDQDRSSFLENLVQELFRAHGTP